MNKEELEFFPRETAKDIIVEQDLNELLGMWLS